jgi:hypothetical protein
LRDVINIVIWTYIALMLLMSSVLGCDKPPDRTASAAGHAPQPESKPKDPDSALDPDQIERLSPVVVHERVIGGDALLVCAYESDLAFRAARLEGAISVQEFRSRIPSLVAGQEIIFYCS